MARLPLASLLALPLLILGLGHAEAQPGATPPGATPPAGQPDSTGQPNATVQTRPWQKKWGFGLHASSAELVSSVNPDNTMKFRGGGLHVRYRLNERWGLEVSLDRLEGEYMPGITRDSRPMTMTGMLHLSPGSVDWNWYLLAGFGASRDLVSETGGNGEVEIEYRQVHVHLGGGVERRWDSFGLGIELRLIGTGRNEQYNSPGAPLDGPVPQESSGGMLSVLGTYYF